jgi:RNA polymerase sigma-70 factor (ECF subfamily)
MSKALADTASTNRTRTSLLRRMKNWEDKDTWQRFFDTYWKLIYHVAIKSGLTEVEAQDAVQETVLTIAKNIKDFEYNRAAGSFRGWLMKTTRWRIADQFRKRLPASKSPPRPAGETRRTATIERIPDPAGVDLDAIWETEWQKNLIEAALTRVRRKVDAKQYEVFDFYANKGMSVGDVARSQGVSIGYVYLTKHRVAALLKKEVARLEKNPV